MPERRETSTKKGGGVLGIDRLTSSSYYMLEFALFIALVVAAAISIYKLLVFSASLLYTNTPTEYRETIIRVIDVGLFTLIIIDISRTLAISISTRKFVVEGIIEAGMIAIIREFVALTLGEIPQQKAYLLLAVFLGLFSAWGFSRYLSYLERKTLVRKSIMVKEGQEGMTLGTSASSLESSPPRRTGPGENRG